MKDLFHNDQIGFISYTSELDGQEFRCPIYSWKGYGVTCPSLMTTNGSAEHIAEYIIAMKKSGKRMACILDGERFEDKSKDKIRAKLIELHEANKE